MNKSRNKTVRNIQIADKFVRNYKHVCLVPNCGKPAIRSHSIQKAAIESALAVDGHVYTINTSFLSILNSDSRQEMEIIRISAKRAGTFCGYCQEHDNRMFLPIETSDDKKRRNMYVALYGRAISLEFCRKRDVYLFSSKMYELEKNSQSAKVVWKKINEQDKYNAAYFYEKVLAPIFHPPDLGGTTRIDYFVAPFPANLYVSCCGVFNVDNNDSNSIITYNLISYEDMSFLALAAKKTDVDYIGLFLNQYEGLDEIAKITNDIAFLKGEEPIISPTLWDSLSLSQKKMIGRSLVHPDYRTNNDSLDIIKFPRDLSYKYQEEDFLRRLSLDEKIVHQIKERAGK